MKILYTPFDGKKLPFKSIAQACRELGLKEKTVSTAFARARKKGTPERYVWSDGKIERL